VALVCADRLGHRARRQIAVATDSQNRMTYPVTLTHSGRRFSSEDLALMRQAAQEYAGLGVTEIARTICEWLDWKRPDGHLKNHQCRLLLERLRDQGVLTLPALAHSGRRGPRSVVTNSLSDTRARIETNMANLEPLRLNLVDHDGSLFRQFIQRYHYLGYRTPVGPVPFCLTSLTV
jgi:hypothetical protein